MKNCAVLIPHGHVVRSNLNRVTESERERESRLRDFPELKTRSSPAVNTAEVRRAPSRIPPPRAFATPANANAKTPPPPPPRKTWAEAKRAIDGVKLPSLIKIK